MRMGFESCYLFKRVYMLRLTVYPTVIDSFEVLRGIDLAGMGSHWPYSNPIYTNYLCHNAGRPPAAPEVRTLGG